MFFRVAVYTWVIVFALIVSPCTTIVQSSTPTAGQIWKEPVTGMEFVWVPGGCYEMGCGNWTSDCYRDEKPVHEVCVDGFWMGKTEVTQGQWKQITEDNPAEFKKGDNYPVEMVKRPEVKKFIQKLSSLSKSAYEFRLPTEAEWEYACRSGGKLEKYAGGRDLDQVGWHTGNSNRSSHTVATKAPNGLGLFDMNGNVQEWCEDTYNGLSYRRHKRNNPLYIDREFSSAVIRGGSWSSKRKYARCGARERGMTYAKPPLLYPHLSSDTGFRLVRDE